MKNQLSTLNVLRNLKDVQYRLGTCTIEELELAEFKLSHYLLNN